VGQFGAIGEDAADDQAQRIIGRGTVRSGGDVARRGALMRLVPFAMVVALLGALAPSTASAQAWEPPTTVFYEEAGHTLDRLFLDLWREQSELLGDPITEELAAKTGLGLTENAEQTVQYFENAALVYLPENEPGDQVKLLDLGRDAFEIESLGVRAPRALPEAVRGSDCGTLSDELCVEVEGTDYTVRHGFKSYWEERDAGLWLGLPLTDEFATGGGMVQYFERAVLTWKPGGDVVPRALGREAAKRLKLNTNPIDAPADIPIYSEDLFVPPPEPEPIVEGDEELGWSVGGYGPGPVQGGYQEIVISISAQALWAYEDGEMVMSTYVSTGTAEVPETVTPIGYHSILSKIDMQTMEGTISNEYYNVPDVPWVMYFDNLGNALHGTYWHSNFGSPMSHGCVNLPLDVAEWMYAWAPIGTPVTVIE
jgi:hypothetical protein